MQAVPDDYTRAGKYLDEGREIPDGLIDAIARDLPLRRANAESFAPTAWKVPTTLRRILGTAAVTALALFTVVLFASGAGFIAIVSFVFTLIVVRFMVDSDRLYRQSRVSMTMVCGGCGYPLCDLPDAIPPDRTGGAPVGPRRCPECGCDWPRVPRLVEA